MERVLCIIFILTVSSVLIISINKNHNNMIFDKDTTAVLRGIAMIGIILHHISNRCGFSSSWLMSPIGYIATGLFIFISGYGNELSIIKKGTDISWIVKKVRKIYLPFLVAYILYLITLGIGYSELFPTIKDIAIDLVTVSLPNQVSWFPKVIIGCFIIHWIISKNKNTIFQVSALSAISIIFLLYMHINGYQSYWYNTIMCYPIGAIIAVMNKEKHKYGIHIASVYTIIFVYCCFLNRSQFAQIIGSISFSLACYLLSEYFVLKNKNFAWIGNNSFEFYILHCVCLQAFSVFINVNKLLYLVAVIIISTILVVIYVSVSYYFEKKNKK